MAHHQLQYLPDSKLPMLLIKLDGNHTLATSLGGATLGVQVTSVIKAKSKMAAYLKDPVKDHMIFETGVTESLDDGVEVKGELISVEDISPLYKHLVSF